MAQFMGIVRGQRGEASRLGTKGSGMAVTAASWSGAIRVELYVDAQGRDCYRVRQMPWHGRGVAQVIAEGVCGELSAVEVAHA